MRDRGRLAVTLLLSCSLAGSCALAFPACNKDAADERSAPEREGPGAPAPSASGMPRQNTDRAAAAPVLTAEERATIEQVMAARDAIATIAEEHAADCDAAAKEIEVVVERSRSLLTASSAIERDPAKHAWIGEKYGARMLASSSKLMALMENCDPHEGLSRIFESLD